MNRFQFLPSSQAEHSALRTQYLDHLRYAQDALVEILIHEGQFFTIRKTGKNQRDLGYLVLVYRDFGPTIVEFHLREDACPMAQEVFPAAIKQLGIKVALVKTFDELFLSCSMDHCETVVSQGYLVRHYTPTELPNIDRITYTQYQAQPSDLDKILTVKQDVFIDSDRIKEGLEAGWITIFENNGNTIGFCLLRPIIPGRPDVELGIAVDSAYRNRGYALYMMQEMLRHCSQSNQLAVSGCSRQNEPSIRMGLRVGMYSKHRLLRVALRL